MARLLTGWKRSATNNTGADEGVSVSLISRAISAPEFGSSPEQEMDGSL
jgi:hypothetical protein